ncbi:MAG: NUDIX hydrolase [Burkholderiales bacterium]|nr:MAG: NUDIX hydrolase [Burkholderiales bacterium]
MKPDQLAETLLVSKQVYKGGFLDVRRDTVQLPGGTSTEREYIVHPGACVVIPLLDSGDVILEKQFRYPVGREMIEFPAGKLDANEDPLICALRELREETGYTASEWAYAGCMHLAIAYSTEVIHIYFARGLVQGERDLDEGEFLDVFTAPAQQLIGWCADGTVTDAKTVTCALHLQQFLAGSKQVGWNAVPRIAGAAK